MKPKKVDYAAIEHAEHEAEVAREKVRLLKLQALLASGWTVRIERYKLGDRVKEYELWTPPPTMKRARVRRAWRDKDDYLGVGAAYVRHRNHMRRTCGPSSCERPPRARA